MMWGLVPPWHRSDTPKGHGLTTNNARIENILESKLFKPSLCDRKQKCVIVCDGFYEWKTFKDQTKQPYLIYSRQSGDKELESPNDGCKYENTSNILKIQTSEKLSGDNWTEDGWKGKPWRSNI